MKNKDDAEDKPKDKNGNEKITKDMTLATVVSKYPETIGVFFRHGLHCFGCHIAAWETVEQGAIGHGIDVDTLMKDLNDVVKKGKDKE